MQGLKQGGDARRGRVAGRGRGRLAREARGAPRTSPREQAIVPRSLPCVRGQAWGRQGTAVPPFELRFSAITEGAARAHAEAVTLLCGDPEWEPRVVVFDKARLEPDLTSAYGNLGDDRGRGGEASHLSVVRTAPEEQARRKQ